MLRRILFFTLLMGACALLLESAAAQTAVLTPIRNEAAVDFPETVTFTLELEPGSQVVDAVLTYDVAQFSCVEAAASVPVEVTGDILEWTWVMTRSGNPPPGAELWWQWTLTTADDETITTPRQSLVLEDGRFAWQTVAADGIRLHWYEGETVGSTLLEAAVAGLARLQADMGIELQSEVQLFIYGDSREMRDAVLYIQDWAGGVAFPEYNVILMGVPPGIAETWGRETVRHELAHLVIGQFGQSCIGGRRPTWLNEGLAVYAEGEPDAETLADVRRGVEENEFEPLRSLNGAFPAHDSAASMAYSQSYSVVDYMLDAYGQEKMQALLLALADGAGYDEALMQVYGLNVDQLELAWREAIDAPPRQIPPTPTPLVAAAVPTFVPAGAPVSVPTPETAASPPATTQPPSPGICGLALIPLFALGFIFRRKKFDII